MSATPPNPAPQPQPATNDAASGQSGTLTLPGGIKIAGAGGSIVVALALIWQQAVSMHNEALSRISTVERKVDVVASQLEDVRAAQKETNGDIRDLRKDLWSKGVSSVPPSGLGVGKTFDLSMKPGGEGFPTP